MLETLPHRADTKLVPVLLLISTATLASRFTSLGLELALLVISQEDRVLLGPLLHAGFSFSAPIYTPASRTTEQPSGDREDRSVCPQTGDPQSKEPLWWALCRPAAAVARAPVM